MNAKDLNGHHLGQRVTLAGDSNPPERVTGVLVSVRHRMNDADQVEARIKLQTLGGCALLRVPGDVDLISAGAGERPAGVRSLDRWQPCVAPRSRLPAVVAACEDRSDSEPGRQDCGRIQEVPYRDSLMTIDAPQALVTATAGATGPTGPTGPPGPGVGYEDSRRHPGETGQSGVGPQPRAAQSPAAHGG